ncbi:MAG: hypothetical protein KF894_27885 [Labilithrix sp.]|nr:hypothetical protein [Labilithrix sp.]
MKLSLDRHLRARAFAPVLALGSAVGFLGAFANCAASEQEPGIDIDAGREVTLGAPDAQPSDASCDADDAGCVVAPDCSQVDWCVVPSGVRSSERLTSVWGSSKTDVWAVGSRGSAVHYDGAAWKAVPIDNKSTFFSVWGSGPSDVWAVSDTMTIMRSGGFADGGVTWTRLPPVSVAPYFETATTVMFGFGPDDFRIGTQPKDDGPNQTSGNMLVKAASPVEEGKSPLTRVGGLKGTVTGIWGSSPDDVWILVDNRRTNSNYQGSAIEAGKTLHGRPAAPGVDTKGDPLDWTPVDSQATVVLRGIWGSSASDVWAVGDHGTVRRIHPNDLRWQIVDSPTTANLRAVWGTGPEDIWIVGDAGTVLHWDGLELKPATTQLPETDAPNLYGVWGSSADDVWAVGEHTVLHYTGAKAPPSEGP